MEQYYLSADIFSTFTKGYQYGSKGDLVKLISVSGNVAIVEGKTGRFPALKEKLIIKTIK